MIPKGTRQHLGERMSLIDFVDQFWANSWDGTTAA